MTSGSLTTAILLGLICLTSNSCGLSQKSRLDQPSFARGNVDLRSSDDSQILVQFVKPVCGTGAAQDVLNGANCTFPGAVSPFGMIQWSPDTGIGAHCGGYFYDETTISGFSLDHISGAGCAYGEDFAFMPILGSVDNSPNRQRGVFGTRFSHTNEVARPGYYAVTLDNGIKIELTATKRSGFGRFTYPAHKQATMMINSDSAYNTADAASINIHPGARAVCGRSVGGHFCWTPQNETRAIYFYAVFNQPFATYSTWSGTILTKGGTNGTGAFISFDTSDGQPVLAKVGISYVSVANAQANLATENPVSAFASSDFDRAVVAAGETWNKWLNKIQVNGGTVTERQTFYSMLYHTLLSPSIVSDVNGDYTGYDGKIHTVANGHDQYGVFSGWDIYRSECQLLAMIAPKEASDMAQSLLMDYLQDGAFPRWGVIAQDSGVMVGDPSAPMIGDFYAYGATNFDARAALAGLVHAATDPSVQSWHTKAPERPALDDYLKLGYVPEHEGGDGCVSISLEYNSADFALAQLAKKLGDKSNYDLLMKHAQSWRKLYNSETGYLQMRRKDGSWAPGFVNNSIHYDNAHAYVEGTAGQYVWMVPFNYKTLFEMMGGPVTASKRLDAFFTKLNVGQDGPDAWMAWLGNEPCLETPWIYDFLGQPYKTQSIVRQAMMKLYSDQAAAYPGNDDLGEMSSWYVLSALGMYPEIPGSDVLVLGSPLFPKSVLHLQGGDVTIIGDGAAADAPYVQSLRLNGKEWDKPWIRFSDIAHGGRLVYKLGPASNKEWGSDLRDAPPSFTDGM